MAVETQSLMYKGDERQDAIVVSLDEYSPFRDVTPPLSKPSSATPPHFLQHYETAFHPKTPLSTDLAGLYSENVIAKAYRTAIKSLPANALQAVEPGSPLAPELLPASFPEYVPQHGDQAGIYTHREPEFWTCGFFPGTLYGILERLIKFPNSIVLPPRLLQGPDASLDINRLRAEFSKLCRLWSEPLHAMASRTDTHDVGFIVMPALRQCWELTNDSRSLDSIIQAAQSLASRYVPSAGAIRSWDVRIQKNIQITSLDEDLILIIDSMCNLDLLYYAASHSSGAVATELYDIATAHADTLMRTHLRPESMRLDSRTQDSTAYRGQWYSVYHVANLNPKTGNIKRQFTAQGYSDTSTWARGQAWGILGYAQTYMWTKDKKFLKASCGLAEYFMYRLETGPTSAEAAMSCFADNEDNIIDDASCTHHGGRYVPPWDFDAPVEDPSNPIRDSSAGAIAANGMLVLSQGLAGLGYHQLATRFRCAAIDVARDLVNFAVAPEKAKLVANPIIDVVDEAPTQTFESILKFGTANNNVNAKKQYANHGLVYGDYYLVELGNRLLRMGLD